MFNVVLDFYLNNVFLIELGLYDHLDSEQSLSSLCTALVCVRMFSCLSAESWWHSQKDPFTVSSTNNIQEWNEPPCGWKESCVICCSWFRSGVIHAEIQMQDKFYRLLTSFETTHECRHKHRYTWYILRCEVYIYIWMYGCVSTWFCVCISMCTLVIFL